MISIPSISTGRNKFPKLDAARIAVEEAFRASGAFSRTVFAVMDEENYAVYSSLLNDRPKLKLSA